jgi:hypothetical protein
MLATGHPTTWILAIEQGMLVTRFIPWRMTREEILDVLLRSCAKNHKSGFRMHAELTQRNAIRRRTSHSVVVSQRRRRPRNHSHYRNQPRSDRWASASSR